MASLLVVSGPQVGEYYPIGKKKTTIGRAEGCLIQIADDQVSRKHVQVRFEPSDKRYHVQDLNSANGTFLNDQRISNETALNDGDVITIGNSELLFSLQDFTDKETAFEHYRRAGERGKSTIIR